MSVNGTDIKELKAIVEWAHLTEGVRELSLKVGDVELFISKNEHSRGHAAAPAAPAAAPAAAPVAAAAPAAPAVAPAPAAAPAAAAPAAPAAPSGELELAPDEVVVKAPMVGTFYASPQPGAPTFVSVGDAVQPDTVMCIVEVMKLMNNVEARVSGTVTRVLVENEAAVQYGQPLFVIKQA